MPLTPQGIYPRPMERVGTAAQLQVRPNPPHRPKNYQQVRLVPARLPKWLRDGLKGVGFTGTSGFTGAQSVFNTLRPELSRQRQESFIVLYLNVKNMPEAVVEISRGTLDASLVHPRDVFGAAVAANAASMILVHNHPSGDPEPSREDITLTKRLADAGDLMGIAVLDHVIISRDGYVSLAERGIV